MTEILAVFGAVSIAVVFAYAISRAWEYVGNISRNDIALKRQAECISDLYDKIKVIDIALAGVERRIVSLDVRISKIEGPLPGQERL